MATKSNDNQEPKAPLVRGSNKKDKARSAKLYELERNQDSQLAKLEQAIGKREEHWRNTPEDPHGIAIGVMVALAEVKEAIREVRKA